MKIRPSLFFSEIGVFHFWGDVAKRALSVLLLPINSKTPPNKKVQECFAIHSFFQYKY